MDREKEAMNEQVNEWSGMEGKLNHEFSLLPPRLGVFLLLNWVSRKTNPNTRKKVENKNQAFR